MPKRPRNHELETLSQRAFASALPANVLVRPIDDDDYGIDREVEVFTDGETTGLTFKVQLKATDKSGTSRRVKRANLDYWRALDVPVLLVSYEAQTGALRGRWVHSIGADGPDNGAETITVHMDPSIDIGDTWAERLANDLRLIRAVRGGSVPNPTTVRIKVDETTGLSEAQVAAALLNLSRRTRNAMLVTDDADEAALDIEITATRVRAALPLQIASCSLHFAEGTLVEHPDPQAIAELSLMLAAGAVAAVNGECAREWLKAVPADAPWWTMPNLDDRVIAVLDHRDSAAHLLEIHAALVEGHDHGADWFMLPLLDLALEVSEEAFDAYSARIRAAISDDWDGGRTAFNLSNLHRLRRDYAGSLELLEVAVEKAPRYGEDPRYHRDAAECLWELDRFDDSADAYRRVLELGGDAHDTVPLLADALMHAGHYAEALRELGSWEPNGTMSDKAGHLRLVILNYVIDYVGMDDQDRRHFDQEAATRAYDTAVDDGQISDDALLMLLRSTDALHPRLWMHRVSPDGTTVDFHAALICAFMMRHQPVSWVLTLVGALNEHVDETILRAVVDQARWLCGDSFYTATWDFAADQEQEAGDYLRELISAAYASEPEALTNAVRGVDPLGARWVVDLATLGAAAETDSASRNV